MNESGRRIITLEEEDEEEDDDDERTRSDSSDSGSDILCVECNNQLQKPQICHDDEAFFAKTLKFN